MKRMSFVLAATVVLGAVLAEPVVTRWMWAAESGLIG
ncbi:hypothetical protein SUDANB140_06080 [Streptomyces sp. enrichment culture]